MYIKPIQYTTLFSRKFFLRTFAHKRNEFCAVLRKLRKKMRKTKISFHAQHFAKNISGFAQIVQKNSAKPRKTHCVYAQK